MASKFRFFGRPRSLEEWGLQLAVVTPIMPVINWIWPSVFVNWPLYLGAIWVGSSFHLIRLYKQKTSQTETEETVKHD